MTEMEAKLIKVAQAQDTYDLLNHIAWTDVLKPKLEAEVSKLSKLLVSEALGVPIPVGMGTREQIAGKCYGIQYVSRLFEEILAKGENAFKDLEEKGIHLT